MEEQTTAAEKFYTPKIEEFHTGFQYESKQGFQDGTVKTQEQFDNATWESKTTDGFDLAYIDRALNGRNHQNNICGIRVKYLDRSDIEELGWAFKNVYTERDGETFYRGANRIIFWRTERKLFISDPDVGLFEGTIKNKSELKVLLTQIGI